MSRCRVSSPTAPLGYGLIHTECAGPRLQWNVGSGRCRGDDGGDFFPQARETYWLPIINSLVGLVVVFHMCVFCNDLAGYNLDEEATSGGSGDGFDHGDNGWKIIHTDVLCFPPYHSLLCAVLSMRAQFLAPGTGEVIRIRDFSQGVEISR